MSVNVTSPEAMLSFPSLITPKLGPNPKPGDVAQYGCTLVFPKGTDMTALKKAATEALKEKFGDKLESLLKNGSIKLPFRKVGDKYDEEKYEYFINVRRKDKPGIVDRYAGPDGKPAPLTDTEKLYPGCIVRASLSAYAYDVNGNKGVSFGLQHIQWREQGVRLDNRRSAVDSFDAEQRPDAVFEGSSTESAVSKGEALNDLLG